MATAPEDRPKYDPKRILRRGLLVSLALLPVALLIVATTDRPLSWGMWVLATVIVDLILCLLIGGPSLLLGLAISLRNRESEVGKTLIGLGASLTVIFFGGMALVGILYEFLHNS